MKKICTCLFVINFTVSIIILYSAFIIYTIKDENRQQFLLIGTPKENNNVISETLFSAVKIFCIINSSRKEIQNRAIHVNATWAKRCNKYVFLTHDEKINLPFLNLNVTETRHNLWNKWKAAFKWVYKNELNNYDFFLRADDDSYFIMEHLRLMLLPHNPNKPLYFGARFKFGVPMGYMSGGAGVILTRQALKEIVPNFENEKICNQPTTVDDDLELGICAQNLNIQSIDTRNYMGHHTMLPWSPKDHFIKKLDKIQLKYLYYPYHQKQVFECCAETMISFHYVYKEMLYLLEFLIYHGKFFKNDDKEENYGKNESLNTIEKLKEISLKTWPNKS